MEWGHYYGWWGEETAKKKGGKSDGTKKKEIITYIPHEKFLFGCVSLKTLNFFFFFYKVKEKIRYRMDSRGPSWNKVEMGTEKQGDQGRSCWKGTLKRKQPKCPSADEQMKMYFMSMT